jgi:hypothetical protein
MLLSKTNAKVRLKIASDVSHVFLHSGWHLFVLLSDSAQCTCASQKARVRVGVLLMTTFLRPTKFANPDFLWQRITSPSREWSIQLHYNPLENMLVALLQTMN